MERLEPGERRTQVLFHLGGEDATRARGSERAPERITGCSRERLEGGVGRDRSCELGGGHGAER